VTRVLSGVALAVLIVGGIWFLPPLAAVLLAGCILLLAFAEYAGLAEAAGIPFDRASGAAAVLATGAAVALAPGALPVVAMSGGLLIALTVLARGRRENALASAGAAAFSLLYLGLPLGALCALVLDAGREVLLLLIATIAASDTAQYYGGRLLGRRRLAPAVSPGKTVEGAVCGVVAATIAFVSLGAWWLPAFDPSLRVVVGVTLAVSGMAGDLFESHLKRASGMKDSSGLIPGHGGVLDRIDALLFAAPVYYAVLTAGGGRLP
jgi:phosphatidate cytidylyltransferase